MTTAAQDETPQKPTFDVPLKQERNRLKTVLNEIIGFAEQKRTLKGNSDKNKQSWSRIAISAIDSYARLIESSQLETLEERVRKLEDYPKQSPVEQDSEAKTTNINTDLKDYQWALEEATRLNLQSNLHQKQADTPSKTR